MLPGQFGSQRPYVLTWGSSLLSKGLPTQWPELFQDCASGWAYWGAKGGCTYLLPGSMVKVAASLTYSFGHHYQDAKCSSQVLGFGKFTCWDPWYYYAFDSTLATWPSLFMLHTLTLEWSRFSRQSRSCYAYSLRQHVGLVILSLKPMFTWELCPPS